MLSEKIIKFVKICVNIYTSIMSVLIICCLYRVYFIDKCYTEPIAYWPFISGFFIYMNVYKFYKILKSNNNSMSKKQLIIWFFNFGLGILSSLFYLSLAIKSIPGIIGYSLYTMAIIWILNYLEKKI